MRVRIPQRPGSFATVAQTIGNSGAILDVRASAINEEMKLAAACAIAGVIGDDELHAEYIIPSVFNRRVVEAIAEGVADAAVATGVARRAREQARADALAGA